MIPFFPKQLSLPAILLYVGTLTSVSLVFLPYAIEPLYMVLGVMSVAAFFFLSYFFSYRWQDIPRNAYISYLLIWAFSIRIVSMTGLYFYFLLKTGIPFEFQTADALAYHLDSEWLTTVSVKSTFEYMFMTGNSVSDTGYYLYLSLLYRIIGPNIYLARVVKCLLSTLTCLMVYKLSSRTFGEETGRLAGIFCCLAPNLIYYCGLHLKETEMLFLIVAALDVADRTIRSDRKIFWNFLLTAILIFVLFLFRTVVGLAVGFAVLVALFLSSPRVMSFGRRFTLIVLSVAAIAVLSGGIIANEIQNTWENRVENQIAKRDQQTVRGNLWAKYATGTVMAPMMFVIPFPTMVDVDQQYNQQILNGGNYVRNFLGIFVLLSVIGGVFQRREGRRYVLLLTFAVSYLGVVCLSGFANSERFVLPALPILLVLAADGVAHLNEENYHWVKLWYWIVPLMPIGWAVFKLGSRSML